MPIFWISKYALSRGIYSISEDVQENDGVLMHKQNYYTAFFHGEGRDWHRTEAGAKGKADAMRMAKIASLKKQIDKLKAMSFSA